MNNVNSYAILSSNDDLFNGPVDNRGVIVESKFTAYFTDVWRAQHLAIHTYLVIYNYNHGRIVYDDLVFHDLSKFEGNIDAYAMETALYAYQNDYQDFIKEFYSAPNVPVTCPCGKEIKIYSILAELENKRYIPKFCGCGTEVTPF